jgi:hypothetical protein
MNSNNETPVPFLEPCPFCGQTLTLKVGRANPSGRCKTPECIGAGLPVLNLDEPDKIAAWNRRARPAAVAAPDAPQAGLGAASLLWTDAIWAQACDDALAALQRVDPAHVGSRQAIRTVIEATLAAAPPGHASVNDLYRAVRSLQDAFTLIMECEALAEPLAATYLRDPDDEDERLLRIEDVLAAGVRALEALPGLLAPAAAPRAPQAQPESGVQP